MRILRIARYKNAGQSGIFTLSEHVEEKMAKRGISIDHIENALTFGRYTRTRGAKIFAIGRKEVSYYGKLGYNIEKYENTHVVCNNSSILTSYKNKSMKDMKYYKSGRFRK